MGETMSESGEDKFALDETLKKLRTGLGWSSNELARQAQIAGSTVRSAERGLLISASSAKAIAQALSLAYGREIRHDELGLPSYCLVLTAFSDFFAGPINTSLTNGWLLEIRIKRSMSLAFSPSA
jgi:transcriptional regulator with XRE-family HTH domain